jgi:uncharacterized membrane protein
VVAKIGVERLGPFKYLFYSQLIALLVVLGFLAFRGDYSLNSWDYSYFGYPVFGGIVSALAIFILYLLLSKEPGSIAVSLTAIYPIVTVFILTVILRIETLTFQQWVRAFLAILGAFLLSLQVKWSFLCFSPILRSWDTVFALRSLIPCSGYSCLVLARITEKRLRKYPEMVVNTY